MAPALGHDVAQPRCRGECLIMLVLSNAHNASGVVQGKASS